VETVAVGVFRGLILAQEDVKGHDPADEKPNVADEEAKETSLKGALVWRLVFTAFT